jgi:hypothetical protein
MDSIPSDQTLQQLMFSLIEVWKDSGKSQQAFCREKELDYFKFQYWFRKYRRLNPQAVMDADRPRFTQVKIKDSSGITAAKAGLLELIFPDGRKLIFHQPVEASFVRSLLG